jgi:hypothetical protein
VSHHNNWTRENWRRTWRMQNKPSLVINTARWSLALAAALDDFHVLAGVVTLVVPGEVMAELEAGAGHDETAKLV